jgi:hypothetical protein
MRNVNCANSVKEEGTYEIPKERDGWIRSDSTN